MLTDFDSFKLNDVVKQIAKEQNFTVNSKVMILSGLCKNCGDSLKQ